MKKWFLIIFSVGLVSTGLYFLVNNKDKSELTTELITEQTPVIYTNTKHNFSFTEPLGYTTKEIDEGDNQIILIEGKEVNSGFQILVTPFQEENFEITKTILQTEISDMKIDKEETLNINNTKGLLFESDNPAFNNASSELWFVYKYNLYQISGYKESRDIIKEMINTWNFNQ